MIEPGAFAEGMGVLAERFRAPLDASPQQGYYLILSSELSTDEFRIAVQLAFRHARFWPSPQELIDYAKPSHDLDLEASEMFDFVRDMGEDNAGYGRNWRRDKIAELGEPALAGFKAIGANEGLRSLETKNLHWTRQAFMTAYKAKARQTKAEKQIEAARLSITSPLRSRRALPTSPVSVAEVIASQPLTASAAGGVP